ncbi:MAG TPA: ADP-ribosylglycohydrolase family protein [Gemmataceae bacterium]|nr:ADP-ribosylglycohydrolase family protein [Gemmataceae bacterium]
MSARLILQSVSPKGRGSSLWQRKGHSASAIVRAFVNISPEPFDLRDRFVGCLLGLAVGDALGGRFESRPAEHLRERFSSPQALFD